MNKKSPIALDAELQEFAGRIMDVDSHEMIPAQAWVEAFGPGMKPALDRMSQDWSAAGAAELEKDSAGKLSAILSVGQSDKDDLNHPNCPGFVGDVMPIDADIVNVKGSRAPGAVDPQRRLEVMDATGIQRQLVFAGASPKIARLAMFDAGFMPEVSDRWKLTRRFMDMTDDWTVNFARVSERVRPVVYVVTAPSVDELYNYVRKLIDRGIRAFQFPTSTPPGGVSPAHTDLDPLWSMLEEADCTATLHIDGDRDLILATRTWGKAPAFEGYGDFGEFALDPWSLSCMHLAAQNFIATMVMGGVFERHPKLRMGIIELGAGWIGPLMEWLDLWYLNSRVRKHLPQLPSTYIRWNVRVSPLAIENPGELIEKYGLEDVICFATDYPHVEGGKNVAKTFHDKIKHMGPAVAEKFFVSNGAFLMPA